MLDIRYRNQPSDGAISKTRTIAAAPITYDAIPIISTLVPQGFEAWIVTSSAPVDAMTAPTTIQTRLRLNRLLAAKNLGAPSPMPVRIAKTAASVPPVRPR